MSESSSTLLASPRRSWLQAPPVAAGLILLLALVARGIYYSQVRTQLLFLEPTGDAAQFVALARRLQEEGFWAPRGAAYFQAPFYPWYLAALGGPEGLLLARLLQWLAGIVGALLAWDTARRLGGATAGLVAGVLAALYAPRIFFEGELLAISWCLLALQTMLALLVAGGPNPGAARTAAAGAAGALAALAQPNALLAGVAVLGGLAGGAARASSHLRRPRAWSALAFALGLMLPLLPVLVRNRAESGDWILISANSGVNFFIGNHPSADGTFRLPPDVPLRNDSEGLVISSTAVAAAALGGHPGPAAVSGYWFDRGLEFWRTRPLEAVSLTARKLLYLLNTAELPNHYALDFMRDRVPVLRILPTFLLLAVLGLWGGMRRARAPEARLLWLAGVGYLVSVLPFFVTDRYRLPLIAILIPAAGLGFVDLADILSRRRPREMGFAALTLVAFAGLTLVPLVDTSPARAHMHNLSGTLHYRGGNLTEAAREFEQALSIRPGQAEALNNLGRVRLLSGELPAAETCFRGALEQDPRLPEAWFNLEELLRNRQEWAEALRQLDGLEAHVPGARQSYGPTLDFRRGLARQALGDTAEARRLLSDALRFKPDLAAAWAALAGIDRAAGRWSAARAGFERALQLSPDYWAHAYNLGIVCERMGDYAGAENAYTEAARLSPALPEPTYRAAVMRMVLGRVDSAQAMFQDLAARNFTPALYQLGRQAELQGQTVVALDIYRRVVQAGGPQDEIRLAAERLATLEGKR